MITMEFDEIKKIWDEQNQEPLYAINETALHNRIRSKKEKARRIAGFSEIFVILANILAGAIVVISILLKGHGNIYSWLLVGLMGITAVFVFAGRIKRKKRENTFDLTMLGELDHAIANATFQVQFSQIMRWYILPMGTFTILSVWKNESPLWGLLLIALFFGFTWFAGRWEHGIYVRKREELVSLKEKLVRE